jgi:isocitrate dehydrogenase (NAD+)
MDICSQYERKIVLTGRSNGATAKQLGDYILGTIADPKLDSRWEGYVQGKS